MLRTNVRGTADLAFRSRDYMVNFRLHSNQWSVLMRGVLLAFACSAFLSVGPALAGDYYSRGYEAYTGDCCGAAYRNDCCRSGEGRGLLTPPRAYVEPPTYIIPQTVYVDRRIYVNKRVYVIYGYRRHHHEHRYYEPRYFSGD